METLLALLVGLGVRSDLAIAGAFGAAFLVLNRELTPRQAMGAVAGGIGSAIYFTVLTVRVLSTAMSWFPTDVGAERAVAVLWGLGGTFLFAGLIVLAERWKKDPIQTVKDFKELKS